MRNSLSFLQNLLTYVSPYIIIYVSPKERRNQMSPRTGRPIVGNEPKNKRVSLRATETTIRKFQECSEITNKTQTDLLEQMVDDLHDRLTKKEE